jgi:hypothetical protein
MRTAPLRLDGNVPLAPVQPGARVLVLLDCTDTSADVRFHGACGEVVGLIFDDPPSQFPDRPLLEVNVEGLGSEYFFLNEIQLLH